MTHEDSDATYRVIRQDSNGMHYVEETNLTQEAATAFARRREKEIGDHHQTIWTQKISDPLPQPCVP
jgi:hypothetical protein